MPCDSTPRSFARLISKSPGSFAPMTATGTSWPAATFLRSADDLQLFARANVNLANVQLIRIRMLLAFDFT